MKAEPILWGRGYLRSIYAGMLRRCLPGIRHYHSTQSSRGRGSVPAQNHYDVVIVGGGIMGCSSAYFLAQRIPPSSICILERDPTYRISSTVLSVGSIRQQFSTKGNILMSLYSSNFIRNVATLLQVEGEDKPDIQFFNNGYLLLAPKNKIRTLQENYHLQKSIGAQVELLKPPELQERYPWMSTEGVGLACLGVRNEGWFDPWSLLNAFKKKVISTGVQYLKADVTGITVENNLIKNVTAKESGEDFVLSCDHLVNAAGPWAREIAQMAGVGVESQPTPSLRVPLPVCPRKRCVFTIKSPSGPPKGSPLVVDTSGAYFRTEGGEGSYITGMSPPQHLDIVGDDLEVDYSIFEDLIWPKIAMRVPGFENLKVQSAWAGYYDYNTRDQNAIISADPNIPNMVYVNGFSGHGIQQSPAAGRAVSEIILDGRTHSIDLSEFSFHRIIENRPLLEKNVI